MRAAYITETGTPDVIQIGDLPTPEPGQGQVLIDIKASSVNPIDTYIRSGVVSLPIEFPYVPGCDLAGTVIATGPGVSRFRPGDRVWGSNQSLFGRQGTLAESIAVSEEWLYSVPDGVDEATAAAGALVGITAHLGLFLHAGLQPGEVVFVNGGSGGVGSAVVQMARAAGALVITTAGSEANREYCRSLGADLVLDYRSETLDDAIREFSEPQGGIDIWFETQRTPTPDRTIGLLKKRGRFILMAGRDARPEFPVGPFYVKDLRLLGFAMFNASPDEQRVAAEQINQWLTSGRYVPRIGAKFSLDQAADAHRLQEDNTLGMQGTLAGKIVVIP